MSYWFYLAVLIALWMMFDFTGSELRRAKAAQDAKKKREEARKSVDNYMTIRANIARACRDSKKPVSYSETRKRIGERMAEGRKEAAKLRADGYGFLPGNIDEKMTPRPKVLPSDFMPGGSRHGEPLNLPTMILTNKRPDELDPATLKMIRETGAIVLPGITSLEQLGDAFLAHEDTLKARHKAKKKAPKKKR